MKNPGLWNYWEGKKIYDNNFSFLLFLEFDVYDEIHNELWSIIYALINGFSANYFCKVLPHLTNNKYRIIKFFLCCCLFMIIEFIMILLNVLVYQKETVHFFCLIFLIVHLI